MQDDSIRFILSGMRDRGGLVSVPRSFLRNLMMTAEGFQEMYEHFRQGHRDTDSYWYCESIHAELFGRQRYADFDSFRLTIRRKKQNTP